MKITDIIKKSGRSCGTVYRTIVDLGIKRTGRPMEIPDADVETVLSILAEKKCRTVAPRGASSDREDFSKLIHKLKNVAERLGYTVITIDFTGPKPKVSVKQLTEKEVKL